MSLQVPKLFFRNMPYQVLLPNDMCYCRKELDIAFSRFPQAPALITALTSSPEFMLADMKRTLTNSITESLYRSRFRRWNWFMICLSNGILLSFEVKRTSVLPNIDYFCQCYVRHLKVSARTQFTLRAPQTSPNHNPLKSALPGTYSSSEAPTTERVHRRLKDACAEFSSPAKC